MKLDRGKPYSTISGVFADLPDARYEQDGRFFDWQGEVIGLADDDQQHSGSGPEGSDLPDARAAGTETEANTAESKPLRRSRTTKAAS